MSIVRFIMIGGFLGAGKTTAILRLGEYLGKQGRRIGVVTNDQSVGLADTARVRAAGLSVAEITGGCFCCKFNSLVDAARSLKAAGAPEVIIAEPVGSCTDLQATVSYPLRQLYGREYRIAPLSVLVDPVRCAGMLGLLPEKRFSAKVVYVYRKQLEEAEVLVINKADAVDAALRRRLRAALVDEFPWARTVEVSCLTGEGLDAWFGSILGGDLGARAAMPLDYDAYAEGEARLGWLNSEALVSADTPFDGNALLLRLITQLQQRLGAARAELAHLKMTISPVPHPVFTASSGAPAQDLAAISVTRHDELPQATHTLVAPLMHGHLIVNLRAEADPDQLQALVLEVLAADPLARITLRACAAFRPGRPVPTHRMANAP